MATPLNSQKAPGEGVTRSSCPGRNVTEKSTGYHQFNWEDLETGVFRGSEIEYTLEFDSINEQYHSSTFLGPMGSFSGFEWSDFDIKEEFGEPERVNKLSDTPGIVSKKYLFKYPREEHKGWFCEVFAEHLRCTLVVDDSYKNVLDHIPAVYSGDGPSRCYNFIGQNRVYRYSEFQKTGQGWVDISDIHMLGWSELAYTNNNSSLAIETQDRIFNYSWGIYDYLTSQVTCDRSGVEEGQDDGHLYKTPEDLEFSTELFSKARLFKERRLMVSPEYPYDDDGFFPYDALYNCDMGNGKTWKPGCNELVVEYSCSNTLPVNVLNISYDAPCKYGNHIEQLTRYHIYRYSGFLPEDNTIDFEGNIKTVNRGNELLATNVKKFKYDVAGFFQLIIVCEGRSYGFLYKNEEGKVILYLEDELVYDDLKPSLTSNFISLELLDDQCAIITGTSMFVKESSETCDELIVERNGANSLHIENGDDIPVLIAPYTIKPKKLGQVLCIGVGLADENEPILSIFRYLFKYDKDTILISQKNSVGHNHLDMSNIYKYVNTDGSTYNLIEFSESLLAMYKQLVQFFMVYNPTTIVSSVDIPGLAYLCSLRGVVYYNIRFGISHYSIFNRIVNRYLALLNHDMLQDIILENVPLIGDILLSYTFTNIKYITLDKVSNGGIGCFDLCTQYSKCYDVYLDVCKQHIDIPFILDQLGDYTVLVCDQRLLNYEGITQTFDRHMYEGFHQSRVVIIPNYRGLVMSARAIGCAVIALAVIDDDVRDIDGVKLIKCIDVHQRPLRYILPVIEYGDQSVTKRVGCKSLVKYMCDNFEFLSKKCTFLGHKFGQEGNSLSVLGEQKDGEYCIGYSEDGRTTLFEISIGSDGTVLVISQGHGLPSDIDKFIVLSCDCDEQLFTRCLNQLPILHQTFSVWDIYLQSVLLKPIQYWKDRKWIENLDDNGNLINLCRVYRLSSRHWNKINTDVVYEGTFVSCMLYELGVSFNTFNDNVQLSYRMWFKNRSIDSVGFEVTNDHLHDYINCVARAYVCRIVVYNSSNVYVYNDMYGRTIYLVESESMKYKLLRSDSLLSGIYICENSLPVVFGNLVYRRTGKASGEDLMLVKRYLDSLRVTHVEKKNGGVYCYTDDGIKFISSRKLMLPVTCTYIGNLSVYHFPNFIDDGLRVLYSHIRWKNGTNFHTFRQYVVGTSHGAILLDYVEAPKDYLEIDLQ
jgi:hypothetical protein